MKGRTLNVIVTTILNTLETPVQKVHWTIHGAPKFLLTTQDGKMSAKTENVQNVSFLFELLTWIYLRAAEELPRALPLRPPPPPPVQLPQTQGPVSMALQIKVRLVQTLPPLRSPIQNKTKIAFMTGAV
ncbi:hypothetical protein evm_009000 [Chilo suppressalis]|nr:hypothetical protein evm_009000 [Chilo suppressalis]